MRSDSIKMLGRIRRITRNYQVLSKNVTMADIDMETGAAATGATGANEPDATTKAVCKGTYLKYINVHFKSVHTKKRWRPNGGHRVEHNLKNCHLLLNTLGVCVSNRVV